MNTAYIGPIVTVDPVVLGYSYDNGLHVYRIPRDREPYQGKYTLPGVYVNKQETIRQAIVRAVTNKTTLDVSSLTIFEPFKVYDNVGRDPRGHSLSLACVCLVGPEQVDLSDLNWVSVKSLSATVDDSLFGFDHSNIILEGVSWTAGRLLVDAAFLATLLGDTEFRGATIKTLIEECGIKHDPSNFNKMLSTVPFLTKTFRHTGTAKKGRPSAVWKLTGDL